MPFHHLQQPTLPPPPAVVVVVVVVPSICPGVYLPPQFQQVVRDKRTGKTKGYGFVSFANPTDLAAALKEMNGKYVGNLPIKLRKSKWKDRTDFQALEKQKLHGQKKLRLPKKSVLHN